MKRKYSFLQLFIVIIFLIIIILAIGTIGFHYISDIEWLDALHNSALYLAGMGPIYEHKTRNEKIFSTVYAILASILFLAIIIFIVDQILQLEIFNR
jgi:preprotein translocase subunit SecE